MNTLPSEITSLILVRLPAKSILQCRCVCKTWLFIIDNPHFAETHLSIVTTQEHSSTFIFLPTLRHGIYVAQADQDSQIIKSRKVDLSYTETPFFIFDSYNGLVCLSSGVHKKNKEIDCFIYICNLCTRLTVCLPLYNSPECSTATLLLGFGLDLLSKKYKVVQIFGVINGDSYDRQEVQVYTLGSNSWRNIGYAPDFHFICGLTAFVSGSCHWLAKDSAGSIIIVSFDLGYEVFGVIPSPEFSLHSDSDSVRFRIVKLGGRLSIVDCSFDDRIEIWILKEYDMKKKLWIKHLVKKGDVMHWQRECYPISISKNGDILLVCDSKKLVYYNTGSEKCTPLEADGFYGRAHNQGTLPSNFGVFSHVESLIPL
ncbi:hypothetical protein AQUCO_04700027v1 [Aquilegia coerulea]|uniref:F-box domain-containing protein n=1 Tax=Aquilegia coerulea TaxID=218851 RepID=A0A2G5CKN8_AQUCA|nr:hypothetical protein AQUCO_04700027v1 [Aquilegia coerulea]